MGEQRRHSVGWWGGAAVFWLLAAWLITVGLSSIIPQIFPPAVHGEGPDSCATELRTLEKEVLDQTSAAMAQAPGPSAREALTAWLAAWDERHTAARTHCTAGELPTWEELARLRHGMRSLVDRFDQEQAARIRKLDAALGTDRGPPAP